MIKYDLIFSIKKSSLLLFFLKDGSSYLVFSFCREEGCKENIKRARRIAMLARRCSDEFKGTCDVDFSIKVIIFAKLLYNLTDVYSNCREIKRRSST